MVAEDDRLLRRLDQLTWLLPIAPAVGFAALLNMVANSPVPDHALDALGDALQCWAYAAFLGAALAFLQLVLELENRGVAGLKTWMARIGFALYGGLFWGGFHALENLHARGWKLG